MSAFDKVSQPLTRKIRQAVARCVVALVNDAAKMQGLQVQVLADEVLDNREHFQHYGFTSVPHAGAEGIMLSVNGQRAHGVVINVDDRRYRLTGLAPGEVAIYDDLGQKIELKRDQIKVTAPKVVVVSDDVHLGAEGGAKVARIGDRVNVGSGSSAGLWPIVEGSDKVKSA